MRVAKNKNPSPSSSISPQSIPPPVSAVSAGTLQVIYAQIAQQHISGPIPSPEVLRQYDAFSPGLADRLVRIAEQEAEHRRKMEADVIALQRSDQMAYRRSEFAGQLFGLSIGLAAIIGAVIMAVHGAQVAASFLGTGGVTGLVTAFILGRSFLLKQKQQDFDQAMRANAPQADEL